MQVDFYQLSRDPAEVAVAQVAEKVLGAGERLLVVHGEARALAGISRALWAQRADSFLANGLAGDGHESAQPILLADALAPENGARFVALADGLWRDETLDLPDLARVMLFFGEDGLDGARAAWRALKSREGLERRYFSQASGRWQVAG